MKNTAGRRGTLAAVLFIGSGFLITSLVALRLYRDDRTRVYREFVHEIDGYASKIDEQIGEAIAILHSTKGLFDASDFVTRSEFRVFSEFLLTRYPSMLAFGWVPRLRSHERRDAEMRAQSDGVVGFQITETAEQGGLVKAGERDEYYPVYYIEPLTGNEAALAYDLASNPSRREALHASRDTGEPRASRRITLVQETADRWAVLFFVPVYRGKPTNIEERQTSMRGVISGVFRIEDLLKGAGTHTPVDGMIDMRLVDEVSDEESELLCAAELAGVGLVPAYRYEKRLKPTGGRQWKLIAIPSAAYLSGKRMRTPYIAFLLGSFVTLGLFYHWDRLTRERERVERQIDARTGELRAQSATLAGANASLLQEVTARKLLQKRVADVTDHEQRRLGQELHDSLGQQIAVTTMLARSLQQRLAAADEPTTKLLNTLNDSARNAQVQVRALAKGLLPAEVGSGGLREALGHLAASTKGLSDADVRFSCDDGVAVEDGVVATHLYRIAQEALRNSLEHGQGAATTISLSRAGEGLTLAIRDDGKGFSEGASTSSGSGFSSMRNRAELIGATLSIESPEGQGTSVICHLQHNDIRPPA